MRAVPARAVPVSVAERPQVATHRHTSHEHEHEFEPELGLPEPLPRGEQVLWQGAPDWKMLARECFHVRKLSVYFAVLVAWRIGSLVLAGGNVRDVAISGGACVGLAAAALGLATLAAWMSAKTSLYTITDRRIVMRVGIVLSVTFNLPFAKIVAADLRTLPGGHGDVALALDPDSRIAYPHLWPHVRPWRVAHPQPDLRCVVDAAAVARTLTAAWRSVRDEASMSASAAASASTNRPTGRPVSNLHLAPRTTPNDRSIDAAQAA